MMFSGSMDLRDVVIIVGFIATCAVLLWRMGAAEAALKDHEARLRALENQ